VIGCGSDDGSYYYGSGTYPIDADYVASAGYTAAYADGWGDVGLYQNSNAGAGSDAGVATITGPLSAIRALAHGSMDVCPGQVDVTPMTSMVPCTADNKPGDATTGVTLKFNQCKLQNGGTLDGMVTLSSQQNASNTACDSTTTITVHYAGTFSNLSYVAQNGQKTVIQSLMSTGMFDRPIGGTAQMITAMLKASIEHFDASGNLLSQRTFDGNITYAVSGSPSTVTVTSNMTVAAANDAGMATVSMDSLKFEPSCCHAVGGTVTVSSTQTNTFQYGPACGNATENGKTIALGACP
jgi:hypothetical protein